MGADRALQSAATPHWTAAAAWFEPLALAAHHRSSVVLTEAHALPCHCRRAAQPGCHCQNHQHGVAALARLSLMLWPMLLPLAQYARHPCGGANAYTLTSHLCPGPHATVFAAFDQEEGIEVRWRQQHQRHPPKAHEPAAAPSAPALVRSSSSGSHASQTLRSF